jgi:hypothetical protein
MDSIIVYLDRLMDKKYSAKITKEKLVACVLIPDSRDQLEQAKELLNYLNEGITEVLLAPRHDFQAGIRRWCTPVKKNDHH